MENKRYITFITIFIFVGLIFSIKLFSIQVTDQKYKLAAENNAMKVQITYPYRGMIFDRNGKILVQNDPIFDIEIVPSELRVKDTALLCALFEIDKEEFEKRIKAARKYSYLKPSIFEKQVSLEKLSQLQDHWVEFSGFNIVDRTVRKYPHQSLAHVLGYVGEISKKQLEIFNKDKEKSVRDAYRQGDYIGISGLEYHYENYLKGKRGVRRFMVDVKGIEKGKFMDGVYDTISVPGENMVSTIDIDLQAYAEKLMQGKKGSVVVIEPKTGEILALVSSPFYDPNLLTGKEFSQNFATLQIDTNAYLFNRPIMADQYPPGSIFKLLQALIGLQEKVITPDTRFACNRGIISCHGDHSNEDLVGAIQHSCNPYFWNVFREIVNQGKSPSKFKDTEIGLQIWKNHLKSFGLDQRLGIDLPDEKTGQIPGIELYDKIYGKGRWKFSTIYSLAIGQGEIGISPLQMANFVSVIANRGYYYTPHLVKKIGNDDSDIKNFKEKNYTTIDSIHFIPIIEGMQQVVNFGTGLRAQLPDFQVCGKTGTSQNPHGEDHSVFIAFAPKENPQIAVSVYVENSGQGARAAAGIAGLVIEKYMTGEIKRKQMEEYILKGEFIY